MLEITLNWTPNPEVLAQLLALSNQQQKSLETVLSEAVHQYVEAQKSHQEPFLSVEDDPIVGLYEGSPDLSQRDEEILLQEIKPGSGWTCKE
ncbi:MAG: hypothetical protein AB4042_22045 [Leptolyngbyaceae cyanobacterium]